MPRMRTTARAVAAITGAALLLSACSGGDSTSAATGGSTPAPGASDAAPARAKADLVIWTDELKKPAVKVVADQFAKDNGITVDVQVISSDLQAAFVTANAAGNGPDVFTGAHDWIGNLVQNGAIVPLQLSPNQLTAYAPVAVKAETYNGRLYALPYGFEAEALYRNTEVAPDPAKTLDDAFKNGQSAVKAGKVQSAFNLAQGDNGDAYNMESFFTSQGGYLFGAKPSGDLDPQNLGLQSPGALAAAKKISDLGEKGSGVLRRSISNDNAIALFAAGKAAYLVSGPWALADLRKAKLKYAIQPVPPFEGAKPAVPFTGVQGFYVAAGAKNKAFAQEFVVNAMNSEKAMQAMYDGANLPPALISVAEKESADPDVKTFVDAANSGSPMPSIPAMSEVWEPLGKAYAAIIGGADPVSTMKTVDQTIQHAIDGG